MSKKSTKSTKSVKVMSKAVADVIERELVVRKGVLVAVKKMLPAKGTDASKTLIKSCGHTPRVATPRTKIRCMECRPSWATKMEKSERETLAKKAAAYQRKYNA